MLEPAERQRAHFGPFELDLRSGELTLNGRRQTIPEQPLVLLKALLERPGELVTRDELRQQLWSADTFVDFEHGLNAAVKRLRDVLGDSADTPRFVETVPKRGYRFIAPVSVEPRPNDPQRRPDSSETSPQLIEPRRSPKPLRRLLVFTVVSLVAVSVWWASGRYRARSDIASLKAAPRVEQLTALDGVAVWPAFSPDGGQVAFAWNDEKARNVDIYLTIVGSTGVRRLTTDPAVDNNPAWSHAGRQLAFVRCKPGESGCRLHVASPLGDSDAKLSEFPAAGAIAWSPDDRFLAVGRASTGGQPDPTGIFLLPVGGGHGLPITATTAPAFDRAPAFSPDQRRLAYFSCTSKAPQCHIYVVGLDKAFAPIGPPRRLTQEPAVIVGGVAWTRDGNSLIYGTRVGLWIFYLWRVAADGNEPPERIDLAGRGALHPATVASRDLLAFARSSLDTDIYQFEQTHRTSRRLLRSSFLEIQPAFSTRGDRVAFCSSRSGESVEIWVAGSDGSGAKQLTRGPGREQCSPQWSRDDRQIAFDSQGADGQYHVWTIDAEGGAPSQITRKAGDQIMPTWSRNGRWIYFASDQDGSREIWRVRAEGGGDTRITRGGAGLFASESQDAQHVFYQTGDSDSPLMTVPVNGGPSRQVVKCVRAGAFAVTSHGIYFAECGTDISAPVHVIDPATGRRRLFGTLDEPFNFSGLAVSSDGTSMLYTRLVSQNADLMVIENFR